MSKIEARTIHDPALLEVLADIEHERWNKWMLWLYKHGIWNEDGSFTIDAEKAQRWHRLASTPYCRLDEPTKEHDRKEVRKTLAAIHEYILVETPTREPGR